MSLISPRPCQPRLSVFLKLLPGWMALVVGFSLGLSPTHAWPRTRQVRRPRKRAKKRMPPPDPEEIDLATEDGLQMKATYFPGTKGEESIPVILLHGFKGNRKDFTHEQELTAFLQEKLGCAVIVPDLRGHGDSTKIKVGKLITKIDAKKRQPQIAAMVTEDLRAVKDYLWKKNNEKKLNLGKLTVIGVEEGAALALRYTAYDAVGYERGRPRSAR